MVAGVRLAWTHDFRDVAPIMQASLLGQSFQTQDANPGRDAAQIGLQLTAAKSSAFQVFGGYTGSVRSNATAQQGHLGLRARW